MFALGGDLDRLVSKETLAEPRAVADEAASASQQQRQAAAVLSGNFNGDIFAWLTFARSARSIEPVPEQQPGRAHLSPSQIHALLALKDCPNDRIVACLELARHFPNDSTSRTLALGSSVDSGLSLGPSDPALFEAQPWMGATEHCSSQPTSSPHTRLLLSDDLAGYSVNPTLSGRTENHYWCTVCEIPNSYRDSGNWKKHEKEHETVFVCGQDHAAHDSKAYQDHGTKAFTCKRRDIMVNHLSKSHGLSAVQAARDLADKWRVTVKKQAWSCGFCVSLFLNFKDRLRHIDAEHFKKYESIQQWDSMKVILGLLLQPKLEKAWKKRVASLPPWVQPEDLVWTEAFAKNMRTRLEVGPSDESDAKRLVDEVYSASKPKASLNKSVMVPSTAFGFGIAGASSLSLFSQGQVLTTHASGSAPAHRQRPSTTGATAYPTGSSPFGQRYGQVYENDRRAVPSTEFLDDDSRGVYNAPSVYSSEDWVATSEGGTGYFGYDQAVNEGD